MPDEIPREWLEEFEAAAKRSLALRLRYAFIKTYKPVMDDEGKSDRPVVPTKHPNKAATAAAEGVEGRGLTKGNTAEQNAARTQRRDHAAPRQVIHHAVDRFLVAWNNARAQHHCVATLGRDVLVVVHGHARKRRHRLALRS